MGSPRHTTAVLRDAVLVAALAVLTVQALRRFAGDRYPVPSDSMEPTIHGDDEDGDVVFVDKLAGAASRRRGDMVVVEHPEKPGHQLVKRIACVGDEHDACCIDLRDGDVWLGPDLYHMQREQKQPLEVFERLVLWAQATDGDRFRDELLQIGNTGDGLGVPCVDLGPDELRAAATPAVSALRRQRAGGMLPELAVGTALPVDASFLDMHGRRSDNGRFVPVHDAALAVVFAAPVATELFATVDARGEVLTFCWRPADGHLAIWRNGAVHAQHRLTAGATTMLRFGLLDDRYWWWTDGHGERSVVLARPAEWERPAELRLPDGNGALVHLQARGRAGDSIRLASLRVLHDVYAVRDRVIGRPGGVGSWPRHVPAGSWFLLGDNPFDSRDSRQFGPVPEQTFLGVPAFVIGPWPRARWLR